jgi:TRAP-type C4-dicarboxylate transport system permease small subunit
MRQSRIIGIYMKTVNAVGNKVGLVGAWTMIGLMMLTVVDVFMRKFFNAPILGSFEITEFLLVILVFLAIPWAALKKSNVKVDLIVVRFPQKVQAAFSSVTCFLSLIITALFGWYTIPQAFYMLRLEKVSEMLDIPFFPFYFMVAFGFFILVFVLLANLIEFVQKAIRG